MTLYEMTTAASELYDLLQNDEIDEKTVADTLESIGVADKIEDYCTVIEQLEIDIESIEKMQSRLAKKKKTCSNGVERLKTALLEYMQVTSQKKIKTSLHALTVRKSDKVEITNMSEIPTTYIIEQPPKVDKNKIKNALKEGQQVQGVALVNSYTLVVR